MIYIYIIIAVILIIGAYIYEIYKRRKRLRERILKSYGEKINIKNAKVNFEYVRSYFRNKKDNEKFFIDDITWNDLNMDEVFKSMNNTQTSIGEEILYCILRIPLFDKYELIWRDEIIDYFMRNSKDRFKIQFTLGEYGKKNSACITNYFKDPKKPNKDKLLLYRSLRIVPFIFVILTIIKPILAFLVMISIGINIILNWRIKNKHKFEIQDYMYMLGMVNTANKVYSLNIEYINNKFPHIKDSLNNLKAIRNKVILDDSNMYMSDASIWKMYKDNVMLSDIIKYEKILNILYKKVDDFKNIYEYMGYIDSLISIASYRDSLDSYTKPILEKSSEKKEYLEWKDLYHPFIEEPVKNSINIDKSILITGSNASGKSTFLKTLALNAITAQSIYTVYAEEYKSSYFRVYSSMALKDSIFTKESYYMVEIKSLKRILDSIPLEYPILCFVDEILRGTNTIERIAASSEVLNHLAESKNCICVAATHDIELTYILEKNFNNYHFQEEIKDNDITFDYKLYSGRSKSRNAIKILSFIGYDKEIVDRAYDRARVFTKTNKWKEI
ncbi:DNA mismatch repair protein MutS [Clostridium sardiniense]|uniref:DNA mismatch repair protein MutS n=1 Tax=Clostridium sardiniense TaxID=29369 RepID=A0ABS7L2Q6_CLOSR|nr:DNA mismatch repair protein MutS [Clostridium sardiniense]MBY0757344.1 DNA mismatch repair protein MutS [Clostridium sardiniense]MDQ0458516.1 DNA mismatch repair ATPase MutS [Clostridium sardiniense]